MKRFICILLILSLLFSLFGCSVEQSYSSSPSEAEPSVTDAKSDTDTFSDNATKAEDEVLKAKELLEGDKPVQPLDIRDADEYEKGHLPHAMLLNASEIIDRAESLLPLKNTILLVYGDDRHPVDETVNALKSQGYLFVYSLSDFSKWPEELETGKWVDPEKKEKTFSSFVASDISGLWVDESLFSDYDLTMINLWATSCGPCLSEMPELAKLDERYEKDGFQVVGILVDCLGGDGSISMSVVEKARVIIDATGADYTHLLPTEHLAEAKVNQVMYVPETIFVNSRGEIIGDSIVGAHSSDEWEAIILEYLKQVKEQ